MLIEQNSIVNRRMALDFKENEKFRNLSALKAINSKVQRVSENKLFKHSTLSTLQDFKKKAKDRIQDEPDTVPAGVAIGLVEIFAGLLGCIIPLQPIQAIGVGAVIDGIHRLGNGGENLSNNQHSKAPPGVPTPHNESST